MDISTEDVSSSCLNLASSLTSWILTYSFETCFGVQRRSTYSLHARRISQFLTALSDAALRLAMVSMLLVLFSRGDCSVSTNSGQNRNSLFFHITGSRWTPLSCPDSTAR